MPKVDLLCLANSWKSGGRCVAGIRVDDGSWIRPVSETRDGELSADQCTMDIGRQVRPLDVVRIYVGEADPRPHQPENWRVTDRQWRLRDHLSLHDAKGTLKRALETHKSGIFGTSTDRVSSWAEGTKSSLTLVKATSPVFQWGSKPRQKRAVFRHGGTTYDLVMTFEGAPRVGPSQSKWYFTISLGEPFHGDCYKLIAGAIELPSR